MSGFFHRRAFTRKPELSVPVDAGHPHLTDCLGWWALREGAGDQAADVLGLLPPMTRTGTARDIAWSTAEAGTVLHRADDVGDYYETPLSFQSATDPLTIEMIGAWPSHAGLAGIYSFALVSTSTTPQILMQRTADLRYLIGDNFRFTIPYGGALIHSILSFQADDGWHLYHDGIEVGHFATATKPASIGPTFFLASGYQGQAAGDYASVRVWERFIDEKEARDIAINPWAPFERRIWVPVDIGITPIDLNVENLAHNSPTDSVDVESSYILQIDGANHASPLDECAVTLSEAITLLIDGMAHGSVLDEPLITPTYTLIPQPLAHAHALDESAVYWRIDLLANGLAHASRIDTVDVQAAPEIALDVDAITHGHAIDALVIGYEVALAVDGLRHEHPIDAPDVSALLGLLTTVRRDDTTWRINAGQSVDNAAGVDAGWHVIEAIFDGAGSLLSVDGAPVAGNAGVRELNSLTLGAELDGGERLTGDIGELRIYNGALTQTQRDKIRAELQGKWL